MSMSTHHTFIWPLRQLPSRLPHCLATAALVSLTLIAGCGGGGGGGDPGSTASSGVGVGGTGAASGRVSGFGSVIVNGIRFDDSSATVRDDDGLSGALKLGMLVDIRSGDISAVDSNTGLASATASQINYISSIKGPVSAVSANSITVLGQTIAINSATVFEDYANGLSAVRVGDLVEVYAFQIDSAGNHTATRIEHKTTLALYKLTGTVSNLNGSTFNLGATSISYGSASSPIPALRNGLRVRVKLSTSQAGASWSATQIQTADLSLPDGVEAEVEGVITDYLSNASFKVNGVSVQASSSSSLSLANGIRVKVKGGIQSGVLTASSVTVKNSDGSDDADTRLFGTASSHNTAAHTFVVRGVSVHYDSTGTTTDFRDGLTPADLGNTSLQLEVRGNLAAANGAQVEATRIRLKN
jgi:hypothetical protein